MKTILIVDDSSAMRKLIKACLQDLPDACLEEAGTGREALDRLARGRVDLMTLDLGMPDMDGMAVIEAMQNEVQWRAIPIIVLTMRSDTPVRSALRETGVAHYLTKPFQREEIVALATRLLAETPAAPQPSHPG